MKTALLKAKLNEANRLLAIAEQELEAMRALSSNGERTMIATTLKDALGKERYPQIPQTRRRDQCAASHASMRATHLGFFDLLARLRFLDGRPQTQRCRASTRARRGPCSANFYIEPDDGFRREAAVADPGRRGACSLDGASARRSP
jgi:hypothetical protein